MRLKIKEALIQANEQDKSINRIELSKKLWPESSYESQSACMTYLLNGRNARVNTDFIKTICDYLKCTPNFLFGYEEKKPESVCCNQHSCKPADNPQNWTTDISNGITIGKDIAKNEIIRENELICVSDSIYNFLTVDPFSVGSQIVRIVKYKGTKGDMIMTSNGPYPYCMRYSEIDLLVPDRNKELIMECRNGVLKYINK